MADDTFPARLWAMADLFTPMALRVAATLRLADHISAGADSVPALVQRTAADPDAIGRLVDHLVTLAVLERSGTGSLSLTELGEQLREDHPGDGQALLDIEGALGRGDLSALRLLDTVRTGRPAYQLMYGQGFWEDLAADPELAASFDAVMSSRFRSEGPKIAAGYDWGSLSHLIDVGGGDGALLAAILIAHPALRGTLVELPGPAEAAGRTFADAGIGERCQIVARSFFEPLPAGADAYLLSGVLHDWDDGPAREILRRCAEAAGTTGRVLVIEHAVLEGGADSERRTGMDLRMLALTGGRERTLQGLEQLAAETGLRVSDVVTVTDYRTVIDLRPKGPAADRM